MGFLLLSILSSTLLLVLFRYFKHFKVNTFNAIVINYFTASALGFILVGDSKAFYSQEINSWYSIAIIIGVLFVVMFYVIAKSTQTAGVGISSVAAKMSVIIPMLFSILYFKESLPLLKIAGIVLAPASVLLTIYKKDTGSGNTRFLVLPVILFLGVGITDALVKLAQQDFLKGGNILLFSAYLFLFSFITSFLVKMVQGSKAMQDFEPVDLLGGLILGLANFGSLYFFIEALRKSGIDSSLVFGINNIGIVMLSLISGVILFKEKLSKINFAGIALSVIALIILFSI